MERGEEGEDEEEEVVVVMERGKAQEKEMCVSGGQKEYTGLFSYFY